MANSNEISLLVVMVLSEMGSGLKNMEGECFFKMGACAIGTPFCDDLCACIIHVIFGVPLNYSDGLFEHPWAATRVLVSST